MSGFQDVKRTGLPGPAETAHLSTEALREAFLADGLFTAGHLRIRITDMDRFVAGGAMPGGPMPLPACPDFGTAYFTERREIGIVNIGEPGVVLVGGERYSLDRLDGLYIGAGNPEIVFQPCGASKPCFYFLSCPAHAQHSTVRISRNETDVQEIGGERGASRRTVRRYIHPGGASSCQLVMGVTELAEDSVWNTVPPHRHSRRSEVYLYLGLDNSFVMHLMGEPHRTRHLIVRDREAVLSPSWSIHCGAGTGPYSFVWGMAGENQAYSDMDPVDLTELR